MPIDVVKERMQVQQKIILTASTETTVHYRNTAHAFQTIWRNEGIRGVYKGYGASLWSYGPFSALFFLFYEKVFKQILCHFKC